jgi:hypothetical protein
MKTIYEGQIIPGPPIVPVPQSIPDDIVFLNVYNISPHRLTISLSGGYPDIYFPPFYYYEGLYLGVQGGTTLTVGENKSHARVITVTKVTADTGLSTLPGDLSIIGFRADENWQGKRPLIAGAISPTAGAGVATSIVNTGQPAQTAIVTANASGTVGNIRINNDGSLTIQLQDLGAAASVLSFVNGIGAGQATAIFGVQTDLSVSAYYGTIFKILADITAPLTPISSDGNGNLTVHQLKTAVSTVSSNQVCEILVDAVTSRQYQFTITTAGLFHIFESLSGFNLFELDPTIPAINIIGPLVLIAGRQESRGCGGKGKAVGAADIWGFWIPFQHDMTNTPSNVTLAQTTNTNVSTETTSNFSKSGFLLNLTATAAGAFSWTGTYTTVGN